MGVENLFNQSVIITLMLPFIRIVGLFVSMPVIGTHMLPLPIKVILALVITLFSYPVLSQQVANINTNLFHLAFLAMGQFLIGVMIGFLLQVLFQAFVFAGQIIAMQMGLGFASMVDPASGVSVPAVGQIYLMMITLMYFAVDGHIFIFSTIAQSFTVFPVDLFSFDIINFNTVFASVGWLFASGLKIVLPAVIALLLVNISLGILTKAAPQMNIFSIGFPLTMILGMVILYLTLFYIVPHFISYTDLIHSRILEVLDVRA